MVTFEWASSFPGRFFIAYFSSFFCLLPNFLLYSVLFLLLSLSFAFLILICLTFLLLFLSSSSKVLMTQESSLRTHWPLSTPSPSTPSGMYVLQTYRRDSPYLPFPLHLTLSHLFFSFLHTYLFPFPILTFFLDRHFRYFSYFPTQVPHIHCFSPVNSTICFSVWPFLLCHLFPFPSDSPHFSPHSRLPSYLLTPHFFPCSFISILLPFFPPLTFSNHPPLFLIPLLITLPSISFFPFLFLPLLTTLPPLLLLTSPPHRFSSPYAVFLFSSLPFLSFPPLPSPHHHRSHSSSGFVGE